MPLIGFSCWMTCWALSGLSQKLGAPIWLFSWSRRALLPATSKTVSQLGDTAEHLIRPSAQFRVHDVSPHFRGTGGSPDVTTLESRVTEKGSTDNSPSDTS